MSNSANKTMKLGQGFKYMIRGIGIIRRLFPGYIALSSVSSILNAILPLVILYFSARIIDQLAGVRSITLIIIYTGIVVGSTFLFRCMNSVFQRRIDMISSTNWWAMQRFKGEHYAQMDYEYVEDSRVNELLADMRAKENANGLGISRLYWFYPQLIERFCGIISSAALLIGMFKITENLSSTFITSSWATILLAMLMLLPIVLRVLLMKHSTVVMQKVFELIPLTNTIYGYYYRYIRADGAGKDIRIYHQHPTILAFLKENGMSWLTPMSQMESETAGFTAAANATVSGCTYLLIGLRALAGVYSIGQVTQYVGAVTSFSGYLTGFISTCAMMWENAAYLPMLYQFLDMPSLKYQGTLTTEKRVDNEYEIEFHNVSFRYPSTDTYALRNLNIKFSVGRRIAVVGMNGSGKTTMIKLLCRLYDPTDGGITLNGIDIKKYDYDEYMGIFSVVFQDFKLLDLPLVQNVAGDESYDRQLSHDSLNKAGFNETTLANGLNTALYKGYDEDGVVISGGEAQKIALARALYKDAPFIVLDEPTAALDPIAEYEIYSKFNEIVCDKTAIFISHRLSSCRFCDDIAVFHEGHLIQQGSHDDLISDTGGKYFELWNAQAQYYVENKAI